MKLTNFIFGIIVFSIITTLMFGAVHSILTENKVGKPQEWDDLAGDYKKFINETAIIEDSTGRRVLSETELGEAGKDEADVSLIKGAVSGGRLSFSFFSNFQDIVNKVNSNTTTFVDIRIWLAISALAVTFLILVILHFLRGFKTEV